jgi:hypothetical protein
MSVCKGQKEEKFRRRKHNRVKIQDLDEKGRENTHLDDPVQTLFGCRTNVEILVAIDAN